MSEANARDEPGEPGDRPAAGGADGPAGPRGPATCGRCGAEIPADAPGGACPRCALAAALPPSDAPAAPADPTADEVAAKLPAFEILGILGRGGMGVVFKARQKALDRIVALKVLPPATARSPGFADRFAREAKAMARLTHPNIVAVHDFGMSDGLCYLVLEYVDGVNVREAMRAGNIGPREALTIVPQVCDALQYAHDKGVVHRDVKPENVLLTKDGRVKVADFGLAKLADRALGDASLTAAGQVMGTLHYMAPEQWERPKDVDHRADIYSLGVVFYEMLTGELPIGKFEPPSRRVHVDVRLDEIVLRSLERERERRWQHVSDVGTKVGEVSSRPAIDGTPAAPPPPVLAPPADPRNAAGAAASAVPPPAAMSPAAVPAGPWLDARATALAVTAGVALAAVLFAIRISGSGALFAVGLGVTLILLIDKRKKAAHEKDPAKRVAVGPPVAIEIVSAASILLGLVALGIAAFEEYRDTRPRDAADSEPATVVPESPAPPRAPVAPRKPDGRAPFDFVMETSPGEDAKHIPSNVVRQAIFDTWTRAQALGGTKWSPDVAALYTFEARNMLERMDASQRTYVGNDGSLGLPLLDRSRLRAPLSKFRIESVRFGPWANVRFERATVRATDGVTTVRFPMEVASSAAESAWYFTAGPVEVE